MRFWPLIFLTFLLLSLFQQNASRPPSKNKECPFHKPILCAYFLGNKSLVQKEVIRIHRQLNLLHLMTPSGLHLNSLLILVAFFFRRKRTKGWFWFLSLSLLGLMTYPYDGIDSFKRMILFALLRSFPFLNIRKSFFLTFLFAGIFGQLNQNPLSFCLSFIFLGVLLFSPSRVTTFLFLFLAQALMGGWMGNSFHPISAIAGLLLSMVSPLLFLTFLPELIFPSLPISNCWLIFLRYLAHFTHYSLPFSLLVFTPFLYFLPKKNMRALALGLTLLFLTSNLSPNMKGGRFNSPPPKNFLTRKEISDGVRHTYRNGMRCYSKILGDEWRTYCYK